MSPPFDGEPGRLKRVAAKRGRPAIKKPDQVWAEAQKKSLNALIAAADRAGKGRLAGYAQKRLEQLEAALPKRFRDGEPAETYLKLKDAPGPMAALDGMPEARKREVFRGAVEAVRVFLLVRRIVEGNAGERLRAALLGKARVPKKGTEEYAAQLPNLGESADRACGGAWSHWRGRPFLIKTGVLNAALKYLDEGGGKWPRQLRVTSKGKAILVVSRASGASIDAIKDLLGRK